MKTFMKVALLLIVPPLGFAWIFWDFIWNLLSESHKEEMEEQAKRDELLKRATIALEKNAPEEVPFWRANK